MPLALFTVQRCLSSGFLSQREDMREPQWRLEGTEPDYRFSLANERTFLAWIRTALSLLAGGVLLEQFSTKLAPHSAVIALSIGLGLLATLLCGMSYARWRANEIAMRHGRRLPGTLAIPVLAGGTLLVSTAIAVLLVQG
jgi:putative membrane protein